MEEDFYTTGQAAKIFGVTDRGVRKMLDRSLGRPAPEHPEHPICAAARNSSDPQWRGSFFVTEWQEPAEDLSE